MCLGGGGSSAPQPQYLPRIDPPPGPAPGPDTVNDIPISDTGNYNRENLKLGSTEAKPKSQSSKNTGLY